MTKEKNRKRKTIHTYLSWRNHDRHAMGVCLCPLVFPLKATERLKLTKGAVWLSAVFATFLTASLKGDCRQVGLKGHKVKKLHFREAFIWAVIKGNIICPKKSCTGSCKCVCVRVCAQHFIAPHQTNSQGHKLLLSSVPSLSPFSNVFFSSLIPLKSFQWQVTPPWFIYI